MVLNIPELTRGIANDITETIGNTPLVRLNKLTEGIDAEVLVKLESFNPQSSVKDRVGVALIKYGEENGLIKPDTVLIEPTSGNTGIGLAFVAAAKGYRLILTMPESMSQERRKLLAVYGAEIVLTPGSEGMTGAVKKAEELAKEIPNAIIPQQFENEFNPRIHSETTAQEIIRDTNNGTDILVSAVGTTGTITGISKILKKEKPGFQAIAVEPETSQTIGKGEKGPHKIQGIGPGFIPGVFDENLIDGTYPVKDEEAAETQLRLAKEEGIFAGISSGAATYAALQIAKKPENKGKTIVAILADTGERYLSVDWIFQKIFDEYPDEVFPKQ